MTNTEIRPNVLRAAAPHYTVARPLVEGLDREPEMEFTTGTPAACIAGLRDGSVDVALVSTIELFRLPGYRYLAGPAVTGKGFVASVQVFLRKPLEDVRTVALDPASRAARALTRVVLPSRLSDVPTFLDLQVDEDPEQAEADAWLRIGDPALRTYLSPDAPPVFNPSEAWASDTGLPFVFAVWIVRPGVELSDAHLEAFANAAARGTDRIDALAEEASREWNLPLEGCRRYLAEECVYDVGEDLEPAMIAFRDAAAPLALCLPDARPEAIAVPTVECPRG